MRAGFYHASGNEVRLFERAFEQRLPVMLTGPTGCGKTRFVEGQQWLIVTCWFGVVIWVGYVANMTIFADVRYAGVVFPVIGWWLYDIFYITPFLAIPYLHTVNREIFTD
jgi:hypothetical protein